MGPWLPMSYILAWNCRGLGSPSTVSAIRRLISSETPQIIFLSETKMKKKEMEEIRRKLRIEGMLVVDCEGEGRKRKGGLVLLWKPEINIQLTSMSSNHIDVIVEDVQKGDWRFTGMYGFPEEDNKVKTGMLLKTLARASVMPWLCGGDFNLMMMSNEKQGGDDFKVAEASILRSAVETCEFVDMGYIGYDFTWSNNRGRSEYPRTSGHIFCKRIVEEKISWIFCHSFK